LNASLRTVVATISGEMIYINTVYLSEDGETSLLLQPVEFFQQQEHSSELIWDAEGVAVVFGGIKYNVTLTFFEPFGDVWFYNPWFTEWSPISFEDLE